MSSITNYTVTGTGGIDEESNTWLLNGLPLNYVGLMFLGWTINEVTGEVLQNPTGTCTITDTSSDTKYDYTVSGTIAKPDISLNVKSGDTVVFTFDGTFVKSNYIEGTLSGEFTGSASLTDG
jgi:hypothetical protein